MYTFVYINTCMYTFQDANLQILHTFLKKHFLPNSLHVDYTFPSQQTNRFSTDCIKMIPLPFSEHWFL